MTNVKDYTTEELERLTTLHEQCSQVQMGEYVCFCQSEIYLRTEVALARMGSLVMSNGAHALLSATSCDLIRRVRSFTDPTELDPPQEAMLAELERRRRPVISNATHAGRKVRIVGGTRVATLLDNVSALRHQRGYEASYHISGCPQYVWAMYNNGYIGGNLAEDWELVS